jgi:hypothetical protein
MKPYHHRACNFTYLPPAGMTEEQCGNLPCMRDTENNIVHSWWELEPAERQAIIEGGVIMFTLHGHTHPPISLGVCQWIIDPSVCPPQHHITYDLHWKPILEKDGALDLDAMKRELHDYQLVMDEVSKAYDDITVGQFSKCNTKAEHIINRVDERIAEAVTNSQKKATESFSQKWRAFKESKLLWWVNRTLHLFGYAIVLVQEEDGTISNAYPERVAYRGFTEDDEDQGFKTLTAYLKEESPQLLKELD